MARSRSTSRACCLGRAPTSPPETGASTYSQPVSRIRAAKSLVATVLSIWLSAGMTGWAQVQGWRGNTSLEKRLEHDLYYIQHWSLGLDLKILWLTLWRGFIHKNAY